MPRRFTADRAEYEQARKEQRRTPEYRAARNARKRKRYAEDLTYRTAVREYQRKYYHGLLTHPNTARARKSRGMREWTPEEEARFAAEVICAVCGTVPRKLFADHCHDCGKYRGPLCMDCNTSEGYLRRWGAVCPLDSPMQTYLDQHKCAETLP